MNISIPKSERIRSDRIRIGFAHLYYIQQYFYFVLQVFFKDTLYFLLKYVLLPVLLTLTQVVLLLITSTFTRLQIQSNLGTTESMIVNDR